jgi:hypothetical protein
MPWYLLDPWLRLVSYYWKNFVSTEVPMVCGTVSVKRLDCSSPNSRRIMRAAVRKHKLDEFQKEFPIFTSIVTEFACPPQHRSRRRRRAKEPALSEFPGLTESEIEAVEALLPHATTAMLALNRGVNKVARVILSVLLMANGTPDAGIDRVARTTGACLTAAAAATALTEAVKGTAKERLEVDPPRIITNAAERAVKRHTAWQSRRAAAGDAPLPPAAAAADNEPVAAADSSQGDSDGSDADPPVAATDSSQGDDDGNDAGPPVEAERDATSVRWRCVIGVSCDNFSMPGGYGNPNSDLITTAWLGETLYDDLRPGMGERLKTLPELAEHLHQLHQQQDLLTRFFWSKRRRAEFQAKYLAPFLAHRLRNLCDGSKLSAVYLGDSRRQIRLWVKEVHKQLPIQEFAGVQRWLMGVPVKARYADLNDFLEALDVSATSRSTLDCVRELTVQHGRRRVRQQSQSVIQRILCPRSSRIPATLAGSPASAPPRMGAAMTRW